MMKKNARNDSRSLTIPDAGLAAMACLRAVTVRSPL